MFNLLVSGNGATWETDQSMKFPVDRFGEYSGEEYKSLSLADAATRERLEQAQTILMYEIVLKGSEAEDVRVGYLQDIRVSGGMVSFRFTETGRIPRATVYELGYFLQLADWEKARTHWAVKEGKIPQKVLSAITETPKRYDVVFSFAGEDREFVRQVAVFLSAREVSVFYDKDEEVNLWGENLQEHFDSIYRKQGRYCVMFISKHYADNDWTRQERRAAFARAMVERRAYILPVRFDATEIPGLDTSLHYLNANGMTPIQLGERILAKLERERI